MSAEIRQFEFEIPIVQSSDSKIEGVLAIPQFSKGVVIFAHGTGSGKHSPRNRYVAQVLNQSGIATALVDLLTKEEASEDERTRKLRFDIKLLSERLALITEWIRQSQETKNLGIGYFGASTGAAAALIVAGQFRNAIKAVVSRGGRVDLASSSFKGLSANLSILFLVGSNDPSNISQNQKAIHQMKEVTNKRLIIVQGAGHLFEEEGKLEEVAKHASSWFEQYLL